MLRRIAPYICALLCSTALFAQEFRAAFTGRVTDPQGAAVPSAKITATQTSTGTRAQTTGGADGQYTIPFLSPGEYTLEAEAPGFKRYVRKGITAGSGEGRVDRTV